MHLVRCLLFALGSNQATRAWTSARVAWCAIALLVALAGAGCQSAPTKHGDRSTLALLPAPVSVERSYGYFSVRQGTRVIVRADNAQALGIARAFAATVATLRGVRLDVLAVAGASESDAIVFVLDPRMPVASEEAYALTISSNHIRVAAASTRGLFYGGMTLAQALTSGANTAEPVRVPCMRIDDHPRFAWRGLMLDSARHYQSPEAIKRLLDAMALTKLNTLHWHLTDDQGWRLEIKKYPRLTDVGAWRIPAGAAAAADIDAATGHPRRYGGYYTQDQVRDLVRYAAERYITIVPEIEMPGHAQAAIAAYPEFGSGGDHPRVSSDWGVHTYLYNVDENTFGFLEDVLAEVIDLFPGRYVHVGGDEAAKDQWQASVRVQQRMRELGVADATALQAYFVQRIEKFLGAHGRKLIGWDEILDGGLPSAATVMSWRGSQGAIDAAAQGHDVVMASSPDLYLDHTQSDAHDEPPGRPPPVTLADIYAFKPLPPEIASANAQHILGAQVNLWTEHMRTDERVEYAAFPRAAALAEVLWSAPERLDWPGFLERLIPQLGHYRALGIRYAESAFEVRIAADYDRASGQVMATLGNQAAFGAIRYTLDGNDPTPASPRYQGPLALSAPTELRAAAFVDAVRLAATQTRRLDRLSLLRKSSEELPSCSPGSGLPLRLEDDAPLTGARAVFLVDIFDPCWIYPRADLDVVDRIEVGVGNLPYNFQLWKDIKNLVVRPAATPDGELEVRLDTCSGALLTAIPLASARTNPATTTLSATLSTRSGVHDLCLTFTRPGVDPMWAIEWVQPIPRGSPGP